MTQQKGKSQLHLRLTNEDWVTCFKDLTRSELGVLFYIRTLDPYGDRDLEIDVPEVGNILGMHRTTVSRAIESLSAKGLIEIEIQRVKVRRVSNKRLTLLRDQNAELMAVNGNSQQLEQISAPSSSVQAPELEKESTSYSEFINTLSDFEKENFLKFALEKVKGFSFPIANIHNYLGALDKSGQPNYVEIHKQFLGSPAGKQAKKESIQKLQDWENHPKKTEWLWGAFKGGIAWINEVEEEREERFNFNEWAMDVNAFKGVCY